MTFVPHVLLADDETFLVNLYRQALEDAGYRVSVVENGEMVVPEARSKKADVIVLDMVLPQLDGLGVLEQLTSDRHTRHIPIIVCTEIGERSEIEAAYARGARAYLLKQHAQPADVVRAVKKMLKKPAKGGEQYE